MTFSSVPEAVADVARGRLVIVADDEDRENEGDLIGAAETITPERINFMTKRGRGLICVSMTAPRADALELPPMTNRNTDPHGTAFTVSVDAHRRFGVTTGISAQDRATTIRVLTDPESTPDDLRRPGHVFPLRARRGGVLRRVGQTEAAVDLARLAGRAPVGVLCEILSEDGTMARRRELEAMAREHDLEFITVEQLVAYRLARERLVERVAEAPLRTARGDFRAVAYRSDIDDRVHVALVLGDVRGKEDVLVRMHAEDPLADAFQALDEPGGAPLAAAMERVRSRGEGVIVYIRRSGSGEALVRRLARAAAPRPARSEEDPRRQALRDYGVGAQILLDLGLTSIRLLTNSRRRIVGLDGYSLRVAGREPLGDAAGEGGEVA